MELLHVADGVAREKQIDREIVIEALEEAIQKAARSKYGYDQDIRAMIDRQSGEVKLKRYQTVVEIMPEINEEEMATADEDHEGTDNVGLITLAHAKRIKPDVAVGDEIIDDLPPFDFGRIAAQTAKQVIIQKVRGAERDRQFEDYKERVGEIINGVVKRTDYGNVTIDLGNAEGYMRRDETIQRENFRIGDRVRGYIYDVRQEQRGPQIFLSRSHPGFLAGLFTQEVPEIYEGVIEIKAVARDPGSRAKFAVMSNDPGLDPVGACVGMRGSRVQVVVNELQGEKIDIVPWSPDIATFIVNALSPAEVSKVVLDEENNRIEVCVPDEQLSLAIGRRGQNVRLASILTQLDIDVLNEVEEAERRMEENKVRTALFMEALDVDDMIGNLLCAEGFRTVEELANCPVEELASIDGFDEGVAEELTNRAKVYLETKAAEFDKQKKDLGINDDIMDVPGLTTTMALTLADKGVKSRDDLADLAGDELIEMLGEGSMTGKEANALIMKAREHWFANEDKSETSEEAAA